MAVESLMKTSQGPKTLELEKTDDGRLRLIITVDKLGMTTKVEYFLEPTEAKGLADALGKRWGGLVP